jgi:hypothetical protein
MKNKYILSGIAALMALVSSASAVTIDITGATAFRTASIDSIIAAYGAGLTDFAHVGTSAGLASLRGARQSIFTGTFPGLSGTTIIRCTWTGSVDGVRTVAGTAGLGETQDFLPLSALTSGGSNDTTAVPGVTGTFGVAAGTDLVVPDLAFSDSFPANSPYNVSNLTNAQVGITVFVPMVNEGSPAGLTNVQEHQLRTMYATGVQSIKYLFPTTDTRNVYATGRSDFSGTRTIYLSEIGYGASNPVQQHKPVTNGASASAGTLAISTLQIWPTNDGNNKSLAWTGGVDVLGNGGFESSSSLRTVFGATSTAVQRKNSAGANLGSPVNLLLLAVFGISDATTAQANGAKALSYNGVSITPAEPLSATDKAKVTEGAYTFWSYQHLMYNNMNADVADVAVVHAQLVADVPANIGTAGIDQADMAVSRADDSSTVAP